MIRAVFYCAWLAIASSALGFEEREVRYALVIGNQAYATAPLKNPINDATAMGDKLEALGFVVTTVADSSLETLQSAIVDFYAAIQPGSSQKSLALVYYAGHAVQINNRNYLVPVDVTADSAAAFLAGLYDINALFERIPRLNALQNIVILDACRNNPFRALNNLVADGLAPLRAPAGTLIAFATEPGSVALDGEGRNGVYTKHLLKHLGRKVPLEDVLKRVRRGVAKETRNQQIPWEHSSLLEDVYVNPPRNRQVPDLITF